MLKPAVGVVRRTSHPMSLVLSPIYTIYGGFVGRDTKSNDCSCKHTTEGGTAGLSMVFMSNVMTHYLQILDLKLRKTRQIMIHFSTL
jgi:hypothetical protein